MYVLMFACVVFTFVIIRLRNRVSRNPVRAGGPAGQILQLAPLAAERPPRGINRMPPAEHAQRGVGHLALFYLSERIGVGGARRKRNQRA